MNVGTLSDDVIVKFLLNELAEEERQEVEEKLFLDDGLHDQLRAVEMDLVDAYARGALAGGERGRFERGFLTSPERQRKVENALALRRYVSKHTAAAEEEAPVPVIGEAKLSRWQAFWAFFSPQHPAMQYTMAALFLAVTAGGAWLLYDGVRLRREVARARSEQIEFEKRARELTEQERRLREREQELQGQIARQSGRAEQLEAELKATQGQRDRLRQEMEGLRRREVETPDRPSVLALVLTPGLTRGGGAAYTIPPDTASVRVHLPLPEEADGFRSYGVTLRTERGEQIWSRSELRPTTSGAGKTLVVRVSPKVLREGRNIFDVRGVTAAGDSKNVAVYPLDVTKR